MGACSAVAVETAVTGVGTEELYKEEYTARQMVEVTVAMAGFVVEKTGEGGELLVRRIVFVFGAIVEKHGLVGAPTGCLRMQFGCDGMREDGAERKVTFAKAFWTHAAPFRFWRDYNTSTPSITVFFAK